MAAVCFTGRGVSQTGEFLTREIWEARARQHGHVVHDKVMFGTNYLVAAQASIDKRVSKVLSAERNGTTVLSYSAWVDLLNGVQPDRAVSPQGTRSQLARDIETVARAGMREDVIRVNWYRLRGECVVQNGSLGLYTGSNARSAQLAAEHHCRERNRLPTVTCRIEYSEDAATWMAACGHPVPSNQIARSRELTARANPASARPAFTPPPEPPKPVAHPLGGVRRIINLDGD